MEELSALKTKKLAELLQIATSLGITEEFESAPEIREAIKKRLEEKTTYVYYAS
jgi:hypothetical protein